MQEIPANTEYTKKELVSIAQANGYEIAPTGRLIIDWVELGLLDSPTRKGRGKGQGWIATWPENQLRLLLFLLYLRVNEKWDIGRLCNVPAWYWLERGDNYASLGQVRRVLKTWKSRYIAPRALINRERAAEQFIQMFDSFIASEDDREKLKNTLVDIQYRRKFDKAALMETVKKVCTPENAYLALASIRTLEAKYLALDLLDLEEEDPLFLSDQEFEKARDYYKASSQVVWEAYPEVLNDPVIGHLSKTHMEDVRVHAGNACLSLITDLGLLRMKRVQESPGQQWQNFIS